MNKNNAENIAAIWSGNYDQIVFIKNGNEDSNPNYHQNYQLILLNDVLEEDVIVSGFFGGEQIYL